MKSSGFTPYSCRFDRLGDRMDVHSVPMTAFRGRRACRSDFTYKETSSIPTKSLDRILGGGGVGLADNGEERNQE